MIMARTEIGSTSKDYAGKGIDYKIQEQMTNVRKWQTRIRVVSTKERRLSKVLSEINVTFCYYGGRANNNEFMI
jgi:transcription initiation factor TFIIB